MNQKKLDETPIEAKWQKYRAQCCDWLNKIQHRDPVLATLLEGEVKKAFTMGVMQGFVIALEPGKDGLKKFVDATLELHNIGQQLVEGAWPFRAEVVRAMHEKEQNPGEPH